MSATTAPNGRGPQAGGGSGNPRAEETRHHKPEPTGTPTMKRTKPEPEGLGHAAMSGVVVGVSGGMLASGMDSIERGLNPYQNIGDIIV